MIPGTLALVMILIVIQHWVMIPLWLFGTIVAISIAKDVVMFPFVWKAYDQKPSTMPGSMIARRGIAIKRLEPVGYIQVGGELWRAEKIGDGPPIEMGDWVCVKRMEGLKLFVVPMKNDDRNRLH
jgi:membrane protein implicated in regulation of membrane protease activity